MDPEPTEQPDEHVRWPSSDAEWAEFVCYWDAVVRRVCRNRGLQPADAADVCQTVMAVLVRLSNRRADFPTVGRLGSYVTRAALTQIQRVWQKAARHSGLPDAHDVVAPAGDEFTRTLLDLIPPDVPEAERFDWLIGQVGEGDRELLRLRWVEGQTFQAISVRLGVRLTTLFDRHRKVLNELRRRLDRDRP